MTTALIGLPVAPSRGRGSKQHAVGRVPDRPRSPPHGGADRNASIAAALAALVVAPSRGRGSKQVGDRRSRCRRWSPPHGGADRNGCLIPSPGRGVPSPPHGGADRNIGVELKRSYYEVAPSRGRGSKHFRPHANAGLRSRPLTGARIETFRRCARCTSSHVAPLTGARIETRTWQPLPAAPGVAPSRGRGSKLTVAMLARNHRRSPPHGGADRNREPRPRTRSVASRPLTGARIETPGRQAPAGSDHVAPVRGDADGSAWSRQHGCFRSAPP